MKNQASLCGGRGQSDGYVVMGSVRWLWCVKNQASLCGGRGQSDGY